MKIKTSLYVPITLLVLFALILSSCAPAATPTPAVEEPEAPAEEAAPTATAAPPAEEPAEEPTEAEAPAPEPTEPEAEAPGEAAWKQRLQTETDFQGEIVLWDWSFEPRNKWMEKYIAEWEAMHPGVTIKYEVMPEGDVGSKLSTAAVAGTGPDFSVLNEEWRVEYQRNGLLAPLPKDIFPQEWRDLLTSTPTLTAEDGELYVTSLGAMGAVIYYDKSLFEQYGLTEEDVPQTWDEVIEVGKQTVKWNDDGTLDTAGFGVNGLAVWMWFDLVAQNGGHFYDEGVTKALWNEPAGVEAAQFIRDLHYEHKLTSEKIPWWGDLYCNNKAVMGYAYSWFPGWVGATCPDKGADLGYAPLPVSEGAPYQGLQLEEDFLAVFKSASPEKQALIWDFIHFLLLEDDQRLLDLAKEFLVPPDRIDLADDPIVQETELLRIGSEVSSMSMRPGPLPMFGDHMKYLDTAFQEILLTDVPVQEALDRAVEQANMDLQSSGKTYTSTEYK